MSRAGGIPGVHAGEDVKPTHLLPKGERIDLDDGTVTYGRPLGHRGPVLTPRNQPHPEGPRRDRRARERHAKRTARQAAGQ